MAVFRCRICGGDIKLQEPGTMAICSYCGTEQAPPSPKELAPIETEDVVQRSAKEQKGHGALGSPAPQAAEAEGTAKLVYEQGTKKALGNYLTRGFRALEDEEWTNANDFFEKALNIDPDCGKAYLGKLLARDQARDLNQWPAKVARRPLKEPIDDIARHNLTEYTALIDQYTIAGYLESEEIRDCLCQALEEGYKEGKFTFDDYELLAAFDGSFPYKSKVKNCLARKGILAKALDNDKLLERCLKFAQGEDLRQLQALKEQAALSLEQAMAEAVQEDQKLLAMYKGLAIRLFEEAEANINALYEARLQLREADYNQALLLLNGSIMDVAAAEEVLIKLGNYRDAASLLAGQPELLRYRQEQMAIMRAQVREKSFQLVIEMFEGFLKYYKKVFYSLLALGGVYFLLDYVVWTSDGGFMSILMFIMTIFICAGVGVHKGIVKKCKDHLEMIRTEYSNGGKALATMTTIRYLSEKDLAAKKKEFQALYDRLYKAEVLLEQGEGRSQYKKSWQQVEEGVAAFLMDE